MKKKSLNNELLADYVGGTFENYVSARMTCFRVKIKSIQIIEADNKPYMKVTFHNYTLRIKRFIQQNRLKKAKFKKTTFYKAIDEVGIGCMSKIYTAKLSVFGDPSFEKNGVIKMRSGCIYETITIFPFLVRAGRNVQVY